MAGKIRTLIESKEYTEALAKLGDAHRIDDAIASLTWGISKYPAIFPLVDGLKTIRIAKTKPVAGSPCLVILFSIQNADEILLHYIEASPNLSSN